MDKTYELLLQEVRQHIIKSKNIKQPIAADTRIELADDQNTLNTGVIYLGDIAQMNSLLENADIQPGACLMVAEVTETGRLANDPRCRELIVVETSCRINTLYNSVSRALTGNLFEEYLLQSAANICWEEKLHQLWRKIRNEKQSTTAEIQKQLKKICPEMKPYISLIIVTSDNSLGYDEWEEALRQLRNAVSAGLFLTEDDEGDEIVGFYFFDNQTFSELENQDKIQQILQQYELRMMVSNSTRDFAKLNTLYMLTRGIASMAEELDLEKKRIYHYERYGMYKVIDLCAQQYMRTLNHSDIIYLVHPVVVHLTRYDERHHTNLRDVLFYYLQNSQDSKRTAEALYMHRNTVANKINQIRTICDIDFREGGLCQRLLFSCQVIRYYERVLKRSLRGDGEVADDYD